MTTFCDLSPRLLPGNWLSSCRLARAGEHLPDTERSLAVCKMDPMIESEVAANQRISGWTQQEVNVSTGAAC